MQPEHHMMPVALAECFGACYLGALETGQTRWRGSSAVSPIESV